MLKNTCIKMGLSSKIFDIFFSLELIRLITRGMHSRMAAQNVLRIMPLWVLVLGQQLPLGNLHFPIQAAYYLKMIPKHMCLRVQKHALLVNTLYRILNYTELRIMFCFYCVFFVHKLIKPSERKLQSPHWIWNSFFQQFWSIRIRW